MCMDCEFDSEKPRWIDNKIEIGHTHVQKKNQTFTCARSHSMNSAVNSIYTEIDTKEEKEKKNGAPIQQK